VGQRVSFYGKLKETPYGLKTAEIRRGSVMRFLIIYPTEKFLFCDSNKNVADCRLRDCKLHHVVRNKPDIVTGSVFIQIYLTACTFRVSLKAVFW